MRCWHCSSGCPEVQPFLLQLEKKSNRVKIRANLSLSCFLCLNVLSLKTTLSCVGIGLGSMAAIDRMLCQAAEHFCISVRRRYFMSVSYKKLWKLLIDKDMKKKDLCEKAGISPASVTKMGRNGHVTTEILEKICTALDCTIEDIIEMLPDGE